MSDLDIIKIIEKILNVELEELDEIESYRKGYALKQNREVIELSLYDCKIKNLNHIISPFKDLTNLTELSLSSNQLRDISPLKDFTNLTELRLSSNQLRDISPLKDLTNLTELSLSSNQLRDITPLKDLTNLTELTLFHNQLIDISPLMDLTKLKTLYLNDNQIIDISPLKVLTNLTRLYLSDNRLTNISDLKYLTKLNFLWLWDNEIKNISPVRNLKRLGEIGLSSNKIEKLPAWITDFDLDILYDDGGNDGKIHIGNNPLKSPPIEIVKQGKEAIRNYFEQLERQGKDKIYEAKLMLVGEPGSGKTTLMNLLFDKNFPVPNKKQKSTLGIDVRQNWGFSIDDNKDFKAHIWDFGGQQIQYMLHQFFLTSDCVYILMAEKRREIANFDYWLNIINILGKNSPVITLFNETNIDFVASFIYDEKKYKNLFPELSLQRLDVNLAKIKDGRFDVLLNTIKNRISNLELIGKEVPARWVDIRRELEKKIKKKHIHINEYFEICRNFEIEKEADQMLILRYFHLLGIVLHFCEDENLCDTLFLDPNWTVDAVYSVLANKDIEKSNGFIKKSDIDKIWSEKGYEFEERAKLLQLMLKDNFELCYKLPETKDNYIVPLLLSPQKPEYPWDNNNNLQFRFQYPFMPKGIVSRLIVRMHEYIDQSNVWKEGVVFRKNGAEAQVIEQKTVREGLKIIEIRLKGKPNSRKDLLTLIREEIKKIQNSSFLNLPYSEMVPCNCKVCITSSASEFYDCKVLEDFLSTNDNEIQCRKSRKMVNIVSLIDAVGIKIVEIEKKSRSDMGEDKSTNITVSPHIHVESHMDATLTATQQQTVTQEVKNVQGLFKNLKEDILDEVEVEVEEEKDKKRIKNELEKVENAFFELEKAASEGKKELPVSTKNRIAEFIDNLSDENSRINKALRLVSKGAEKVQKLGRAYNKFASYFTLPSIPPILLGKENKD